MFKGRLHKSEQLRGGERFALCRDLNRAPLVFPADLRKFEPGLERRHLVDGDQAAIDRDGKVGEILDTVPEAFLGTQHDGDGLGALAVIGNG